MGPGMVIHARGLIKIHGGFAVCACLNTKPVLYAPSKKLRFLYVMYDMQTYARCKTFKDLNCLMI